MSDVNIQIPAGQLNNARRDLDLSIIPKIFHKDPADFVIRCLRQKDGYLCALFNRYYSFANPVYFFDDPKHFEKTDFVHTETAPAKGQVVLYISLPAEHTGSLTYCEAYILVYEKKLFGPRNARFFTVERHFGGTRRLGTVDAGGTHTDHGEAGTMEENIARILSLS